jgi:type IV pilus assembly protein PilE
MDHPRLLARRSNGSGFTLIELMVVVAIIAILGAIALPSYRNYVMRGRIPEATSGLATLQVKMEQSYQDNQTYENTACSNAGRYFTFSCKLTSTTYLLSATGIGPMTGFIYTIDQDNTPSSTVTGVSGWSSPSPNNCWVTSPGGSC